MCLVTIARIWSILAGNKLSAFLAISNWSKISDYNLTINNVTQYRWRKGYCLMAFSILQGGIDPSHHGLTSVGAPEWPSMRKSTNGPTTDNVPGAPTPEDTPNNETIDLQKPDLTCTPDPTQTKAHREVVGVENAGEQVYGKVTGLCNKHCKYSEQWNPWHPFQSADNFQPAQSFSQQRKRWRDQHLRRGLDNFNIESFQSADALSKHLSQLDFGLGEDSWIKGHSHIFGTIYCSDIVKCLQLLWAHLPLLVHLDLEPGSISDLEHCRIYSEMNTATWWYDMRDQLPVRAMIVLVICASSNTHLTSFSSAQYAWPLYVTIGNNQQDFRRTPTKRACIHIGLITCHLTGAKNTDEEWHSEVGTVLSLLRNLDMTGPGLSWHCTDGLQRQCHPLFVAWVGDHPEQVMFSQGPDGSGPMCEIPKGVPMGHSTLGPLNNPRDQDAYSDLVEETSIDVLYTLGVYPIRNQFWRYPFAMSISFGSRMNCIRYSWVQLRTYCTGCSNTWKLEMWRVTLAMSSHRYHYIGASSSSLNHSIPWKSAPGWEKICGAWSEHWQWIALQFLTAAKMMG